MGVDAICCILCRIGRHLRLTFCFFERHFGTQVSIAHSVLRAPLVQLRLQGRQVRVASSSILHFQTMLEWPFASFCGSQSRLALRFPGQARAACASSLRFQRRIGSRAHPRRGHFEHPTLPTRCRGHMPQSAVYAANSGFECTRPDSLGI